MHPMPHPMRDADPGRGDPRPVVPRVQVLRAGTYLDMSGRQVAVTAELMRELADSYDPALYRAPVVIGHPQHDSPAWGAIAAPEARGSSLDVALVDLAPDFVSAHRAGRYPSRSLSWWPRGHAGNPLPAKDRAYFRHLGFLGGHPPAIKGLAPAELADADAGIIEIPLAAAETRDPHPLTPELPAMSDTAAAAPQPNDQQRTDPPALAERTAALDTREAQLAAREAQLAAQEQAMAAAAEGRRRADVVAFAEGLADTARLRPADVPRVIEILLALDEHAGQPAVLFAEPPADGAAPEPQTPGAWLRARLAERTPLVELGETATRERAAGKGSGGKSDADIARKARQLVAEAKARGETLSAAEAVSLAEAQE